MPQVWLLLNIVPLVAWLCLCAWLALRSDPGDSDDGGGGWWRYRPAEPRSGERRPRRGSPRSPLAPSPRSRRPRTRS